MLGLGILYIKAQCRFNVDSTSKYFSNRAYVDIVLVYKGTTLPQCRLNIEIFLELSLYRHYKLDSINLFWRSNNDLFNNIESTSNKPVFNDVDTTNNVVLETTSKKHRSQWHWSTWMKSISIQGRINIDETISKRVLNSTSIRGW